MTIESDGTLDDIIQASNRVKLLNNMSIIQERGHDNAMISTKELFDSLPEKAYPNLPNRRYQVGVPVTGKYEVAKFKNITFEGKEPKNANLKKEFRPKFQSKYLALDEFRGKFWTLEKNSAVAQSAAFSLNTISPKDEKGHQF